MPPLHERTPAPLADAAVVPLRRIAHARSGDKGNDANIGVIARRPSSPPVDVPRA